MMDANAAVNRVYNFSAGPAVLPLPVLEQAQRETAGAAGMRSVGAGDQSPQQAV